MRKNGHDRNGRQRRQCDACKATTTASAEARGRAAVVRPGEHERRKGMLAERTYAKDHPDDPRAATSTSGWWWTHLPLRRAYPRLERLFRNGTLSRVPCPHKRREKPRQASGLFSMEIRLF